MFHPDIKQTVKANRNFRHVLYTTPLSQVVAMSLQPGEDIGREVHEQNDQIFLIIDGEAEIEINGQTFTADDHELIVVPAGTWHNVRNIDDDDDLKVCTIYTPPAHADGTIHRTKADAQAAESELADISDTEMYARAIEDPYS